jgi:hypothetical protein
VAVAALEPHFAANLLEVVGVPPTQQPTSSMFLLSTREQLAAFFAGLTRQQIDKLAATHDLPLLTLA